MFEPATPFIQLSLRGQVMLDEIDDYIDHWHENPGSVQLHEFLGMTWEEYSLWVASPGALAYIVKARHEKSSLVDVVNDNFVDYRLAARSDDMSQVKQIEAWLRNQGKID